MVQPNLEVTKRPGDGGEQRRRSTRLARQVGALAVVQAIRPKTSGRSPLHHTELPGTKRDSKGFVYFVYCAGRVKIGFAADIAARMYGIATHAPFPVTLLMTIAGDIEDEKYYHGMFAPARINLEWFDLSDDLREFLENNFASGTHELFFGAQAECKGYLMEALSRVDEVRGLTGWDA